MNNELPLHLKRAPEPFQEAHLLLFIALLRFRTTGKPELGSVSPGEHTEASSPQPDLSQPRGAEPARCCHPKRVQTDGIASCTASPSSAAEFSEVWGLPVSFGLPSPEPAELRPDPAISGAANRTHPPARASAGSGRRKLPPAARHGRGEAASGAEPRRPRGSVGHSERGGGCRRQGRRGAGPGSLTHREFAPQAGGSQGQIPQHNPHLPGQGRRHLFHCPRPAPNPGRKPRRRRRGAGRDPERESP